MLRKPIRVIEDTHLSGSFQMGACLVKKLSVGIQHTLRIQFEVFREKRIHRLSLHELVPVLLIGKMCVLNGIDGTVEPIDIANVG